MLDLAPRPDRPMPDNGSAPGPARRPDRRRWDRFRCVPAGLPAGQGAGRLHRSGRTLGARPGARNPAGRRRERAVPQV